MPNRILKESICTSENLDNLGNDAEVLFYRLIVQCDDFGRMDARLPVIRARCFPLKIDYLTDDDIAGWLTSLIEAELLFVYLVEDKPYLQITTWEKHQQVRAKKSKHPSPPDGCDPLKSSEIIGNQLLASANNSPRNPIQSNPKRNPKRKAPPQPPVAASSGSEDKQTLEEYQTGLRKEFADLDFDMELRKFHLYWGSGNRKLNKPKLALLNWMNKAREIRKNGAKPSAVKKIPTTEELKQSGGWD